MSAIDWPFARSLEQVLRRDAERLGDRVDRAARGRRSRSRSRSRRASGRRERDRRPRPIAPLPPLPPRPPLPGSAELGNGLLTRFEMSVLATASIAAITVLHVDVLRAWRRRRSSSCRRSVSGAVCVERRAPWPPRRARPCRRRTPRAGEPAGVRASRVVPCSTGPPSTTTASWSAGEPGDADQRAGHPADGHRRHHNTCRDHPSPDHAALPRSTVLIRHAGSTTSLAKCLGLSSTNSLVRPAHQHSRAPLRLDTAWTQWAMRTFSGG